MGSRLGSVGILGLARSGVATARYLSGRLGDDVDRIVAFDSQDTPELRESARELAAMGVEVALGTDEVEGGLDLVVASPGVPPHAALLASARDTGTRVVSELEFAYGRSHSPWIAVTGTNGKTTTTHLIGHLLTAAGMVNHRVGNIGTPAISVVEEASESALLVAEVSSFQLALAEAFHPRVAVLLNITPDHLDWHGSHDAYVADKSRIFAHMGSDDVAVIDVDDPGAAPFAETVAEQGVRVVRVSRDRAVPGGAYLADGVLTLDDPSGPRGLLHRDELLIRGDHNVSNALAAAAAAHAVGARDGDIAEGLRSFTAIEHRLEPVAQIDRVEYINDSKATNPEAARTGLAAYSDRPVVLLLGGRSKGGGFGDLVRDAAGYVRAVVLFGEARGELADAFAGTGVPANAVETLEQAVETASRIAQPGDAVLLSPACASFDEFTDYEERGRTFRGLVRTLETERQLG